MSLRIVQDEVCDEVLGTDAFAILCGMVLHHKYPVELAFAGPARILHRFGTLDPAKLALADPAEFTAICSTKPAIHRRPDVMASHIQRLAEHIEDRYGGDTASVWATAGSADLLYSRLMLMPGLSPRRCRIFVALLAKQLGCRLDGWEQVAGEYADDTVRSVADVRDAASLELLNTTRRDKRKHRKRTERRRPRGGSA